MNYNFDCKELHPKFVIPYNHISQKLLGVVNSTWVELRFEPNHGVSEDTGIGFNTTIDILTFQSSLVTKNPGLYIIFK